MRPRRPLQFLALSRRRLGLPPTRERFANPGGLLRVWRRDSLDQPIGTRIEMLRETNERGDAEWVLAAFDAPDGFGVNAHQLGEAFLRQIRPQSGVGHVAANDAQELFVRHALSWSVSALR